MLSFVIFPSKIGVSVPHMILGILGNTKWYYSFIIKIARNFGVFFTLSCFYFYRSLPQIYYSFRISVYYVVLKIWFLGKWLAKN